MVAVLFGGATALLPIYATDVLGVGAEGFGWMRAMPSLGAIAMGLSLALLPPMRHAGRTLLVAVAAFGVATIVFGLSTSFPLSLAALFCLGAADNISVVVRSTVLQLLTPDAMRGRVAAVNAVFIGTSNEIGELESGTVASVLGAVPTVALGGVMTLLTVGAAASDLALAARPRAARRAEAARGPAGCALWRGRGRDRERRWRVETAHPS